MIIATTAVVIGTNLWIVRSTRDQIIQRYEELPSDRFVLVLGTSNRMRGGKPNPFFNHRMDKAAELFRERGEVVFILSGDNRLSTYNEPAMMRRAMSSRGVPSRSLRLDGAGYRTFDSIIRSREVFGASSLIIITQPFHASRALFLCNQLEIPAVVYAAREPGEYAGFQVYIREYFARTLAVVDVILYTLLNTL